MTNEVAFEQEEKPYQKGEMIYQLRLWPKPHQEVHSRHQTVVDLCDYQGTLRMLPLSLGMYPRLCDDRRLVYQFCQEMMFKADIRNEKEKIGSIA